MNAENIKIIVDGACFMTLIVTLGLRRLRMVT